MTVDQYIQSLEEPQQSIMVEIRRRMKAAFPDATEALSYGVPAFNNTIKKSPTSLGSGMN